MRVGRRFDEGRKVVILDLVGPMITDEDYQRLNDAVEREFQSGQKNFAFYLADMKAINGRGVNRLLNCCELVRQFGGRTVIIGVTPEVLRDLRVKFRNSLSAVFNLYEKEVEALESFGGPPD